MSGFGFAPAPTEENVGINLDTEMMDEDEIRAFEGDDTPSNNIAPGFNASSQPSNLVPNKVHLRGLDNMSTAQIKEFLQTLAVTEPERFEWIDDTSLNMVYPDEATAAQTMASLSLTEVNTPLWEIREAKRASTHPLARLEIRLAQESDKKEKGARERSRYYLFHPEEDHFERRREERRHQKTDSRSSYRERDYNDRRRTRSGSAEYNRRHYNDEENSRRTARNQYGTDGDFYDDAPSSRNENVELFPEGTAIQRRRKANENVELFPDGPSKPSDAPEARQRARSRSPVELFPDRKAGGEDLFANKMADSRRRSASPSDYRMPTPPRAIQDSIPGPPRRGQSPPRPNQKKVRSKNAWTLEDRIDTENGGSGGGGFQIRGTSNEFSIRGRGDEGSKTEDRTMNESQGGGLFDRVERPNEGRRRPGRNRAQDLFG